MAASQEIRSRARKFAPVKLAANSGRRSDAQARLTRKRAVDAALDVFAAKGFEAASLRDIAQLAGLAHGMLRHHFASKDGLWKAAVDAAVGRTAQALKMRAKREAANNDPVQQARSAIRIVLNVHRQHPQLARMLMHEGVRGGPQLAYALESYLPIGETMAPLFRKLQQAGYIQQFDNRSFFLFLLTAGIVPLVMGPLTAWMLHQRQLDAAAANEHVDRILSLVFA